MEIRWNPGIAPAQVGQEVTTTGINSVANGVSQATSAGISAAKDAFEKTTILGQVSGQSIHGGIASAAQHLSPTAYLKGLPLIGNRPESMVQIGTLSGGMGDHKVMEGISKKLSREKLDSLSNFSEGQNFKDIHNLGHLNEASEKEQQARLKYLSGLFQMIHDTIKNSITVVR